MHTRVYKGRNADGVWQIDLKQENVDFG